jgi:cysteine desulfurase/selenocysteine lyase
VSNVLGTINPVKKIIDIAHSKNAKILLDACQSIPHKKIDVKELDCDFMVFSAHKMLGPMGVGVLFGKESLLETSEPFMGGGDMIKEVSTSGSVWNEIPWKFEAGTPNVEGVIGLSSAISYLEKVGMENIEKHESSLLKYAVERMNSMKFINQLGTQDLEKRAGIISFTMKNLHAHDVSAFLAQKNICVRSGMHCAHPLLSRLGLGASVRASFYIYNSKNDIDAMCDILEEVNKSYN